MEDYKKKYEDLITSLKKAKDDEMVRDDRFCVVIDNIVHELKESEDEKIRKEIMDFVVGNTISKDGRRERYLAWLEKQGKVKHTCRNCQTFQDLHQNCPYSPIYQCTNLTEAHKRIDDETHCEFWLEKQYEQKPTDKVEPKFKVGDWVVSNGTNKTYKIDSIDAKDANYIIYTCVPSVYTDEDLPCFSESMIHLWTIEDAKDGDVLVFDDIIMIFKNIKTVCTANTYILYCDKKIVVDDWCDFGHNAQPVTKEQRDLLFQKMKEMGYEWDAEKKELKKIGQKSIDKVEPKFKVGDWVVYDVYNRDEYSRLIIQVYDIRDGRYYFNNNVHFSWTIKECDEKFHLWAIEDAKDGDVLYEKDTETILIFKSQTCGRIKVYCDLWINKSKFTGTNSVDYGRVSEMNLKPATKEQRELLFQKMKEAGYEWDAEKKELKKIEQKPDNKVKSTTSSYITPNPEFFRWIYDRLKYVHNENPDVDYMRSLRERIENMQKPDWSEEDEEQMEFLIAMCDDEQGKCAKYSTMYRECNETKDWLKSLKERMKGGLKL